jgi:NADH dehydrogenase FAD-containing subunit
VGLEVAEYLAEKQPGVTGITVIEMRGACGEGLGMLRKQSIDANLEREGVCTMTDTKCVSIKPGALVADCGGCEKEIPADYVVIAVGSRSVDHAALDAACEKLGIPFWVTGDARQARRAIDATAEGADAALAVHKG